MKKTKGKISDQFGQKEFILMARAIKWSEEDRRIEVDPVAVRRAAKIAYEKGPRTLGKFRYGTNDSGFLEIFNSFQAAIAPVIDIIKGDRKSTKIRLKDGISKENIVQFLQTGKLDMQENTNQFLQTEKLDMQENIQLPVEKATVNEDKEVVVKKKNTTTFPDEQTFAKVALAIRLFEQKKSSTILMRDYKKIVKENGINWPHQRSINGKCYTWCQEITQFCWLCDVTVTNTRVTISIVDNFAEKIYKEFKNSNFEIPEWIISATTIKETPIVKEDKKETPVVKEEPKKETPVVKEEPKKVLARYKETLTKTLPNIMPKQKSDDELIAIYELVREYDTIICTSKINNDGWVSFANISKSITTRKYFSYSFDTVKKIFFNLCSNYPNSVYCNEREVRINATKLFLKEIGAVDAVNKVREIFIKTKSFRDLIQELPEDFEVLDIENFGNEVLCRLNVTRNLQDIYDVFKYSVLKNLFTICPGINQDSEWMNTRIQRMRVSIEDRLTNLSNFTIKQLGYGF